MKIKTFILTFLLVMSCPFLFGQSRTVNVEVRSFSELDEAIQSASTDPNLTANILLKRDIEFSKRIVIPKDVTVYIDINGFNLTCTGDYAFQNEGNLTIVDNGNYDSEYGWSVAKLKSTGILNAYKGSGNLTLKNVIVESNSQSGVVINNKEGGIVSIANGEIIAEGQANVIQNNGSMSIEHAIVRSEYRIVIGKGSQLRLSDTKIYDPNGAYRYDGAFYTAEQINAMNNPNSDPNIPDVITEEGETFFVKAVLDGRPFSSLKDAVVEAVGNNGKVVDLLYNDVEDEIIEITAPITINGNNKTLTSTAEKAINVNVACSEEELVTIKDLTIATTNNENFRTERAINVIKPANLKLENVNAEGFKYTINVTKSGEGSNITTVSGKYSGYAAVNIAANNTTFTANETEFIGVNNVASHPTNSFATIAVNQPEAQENVKVNINGGKVSATTSDNGNRQFIVDFKDNTNSSIVIDAEIEPVGNDVFNGDFKGENNTVAFRAEYADELLAQGYAFEDDAETEGLINVTGVAVAKIDNTPYNTFTEALDAVESAETITLLNVEGDSEQGDEYHFTKEIEFTITGEAPYYALPIVTFQNATVNIDNAIIKTAELDARENATINVKNSTVYPDGGNPIVKSYYNGKINIDNSTVYTHQATTMGYINITNEGVLNVTWQTNVYGNGMINIDNKATLRTSAFNLTAKDYEGRDNTDADRVGQPATVIVDGATLIAGNCYSASGADYSYETESCGINIGTIEGKKAVLNIKNNATVEFYMNEGEYNFVDPIVGVDGTINVINSALKSFNRKTSGRDYIVNNGVINVEGESVIFTNAKAGNKFNLTNVTLDNNSAIAGTNVLVNFAEENNIDGSNFTNTTMTIAEGARLNLSGAVRGGKAITNNGIIFMNDKSEFSTVVDDLSIKTIAGCKVQYADGKYTIVDAYLSDTEFVYNDNTGVGYVTLAEALEEANDNDVIVLIAGGTDPIAMNGAVCGKTVTITTRSKTTEETVEGAEPIETTTNVKADWSTGWLFVGRGGEGDGKLIFENAVIETETATGGSSGLNISCAVFDEDGNQESTKCNGEVEFINSDVQINYVIDRNKMTLTNSKLDVKDRLIVGARPVSETNGETVTAYLVMNNSHITVAKHYVKGDLGFEGLAVLHVNEGSTFTSNATYTINESGVMNISNATATFNDVLTNNGYVNVYGESTVNSVKSLDQESTGGINMYDVTLDNATKLTGKGAKITFNGENKLDGTNLLKSRMTIAEGASLELKGDVKGGNTVTNNGTITMDVTEENGVHTTTFTTPISGLEIGTTEPHHTVEFNDVDTDVAKHYYYVRNNDYDFYINEVGYETFAEAIAAVKDGDTIVIEGEEGDKEEASVTYNPAENVTFNITTSENHVSYKFPKFTIGAKVTVNYQNCSYIEGQVVAQGGIANFVGENNIKTIQNIGGSLKVDNAKLTVGTILGDININGESTVVANDITSGKLIMNGATLDQNSNIEKAKAIEFYGNNSLTGIKVEKAIINVDKDATVTLNNSSVRADGLSTIDGELTSTDSEVIFNNVNVNKKLSITRTENATYNYDLKVFNNLNANIGIDFSGVNATIGSLNISEDVTVNVKEGSKVETKSVAGNGTLVINNAEVHATETVATTAYIHLSGTDAKFYYADSNLENVADVYGVYEPSYNATDKYYYLESESKYVAEIDGKHYLTITSALNAVKVNGTITLIHDTEEDVTINKNVIFKSNEAITIDGTITISNGVSFENNVEDLTATNIENTGEITNGSGCSITVNGTLTNNSNSTLENNGTLTAVTITNSGDLTNDNTLTVNGTLTNNSTLTNNGTLTAVTITNSGDLTNDNTLTVNGTLTNNSTLTNNDTLKVKSLNNNNNANVTVADGASLTVKDGSITNNGLTTINGTFESTNTYTYTNYNFTNKGTVSINNGELNLDDYCKFVNENTVDVIGSGAVINIVNAVSGNGTFYMQNVDLTSTSRLMDANIEFKSSNTISTATLTNSDLKVKDGASLSVNSNLSLGNGTLTNNGTIYVAKGAELDGYINITHSSTTINIEGKVNASSVNVSEGISAYAINLNDHDAKLVTSTKGLNVTTNIDEHRVSYKEEYGWYQLVNTVVAMFDNSKYESLADALNAVPVGSSNAVIELVWEKGNDPIVMTGALSGKNATIKAAANNDPDMVVDWSKGRLYVGRMAGNNNGDATLTFDGVKFTSLNDGGNGENGIWVSTRVKNTEHYRGTLNIVNKSDVEISSIYTQYVTNINNSTVKFLAATGMNVSGVNASYSPTGSATVSKLFVNHSEVVANNVLVGNLGEGYMLVDVTVDDETLTYTPDADEDSEITINRTLDVLAGGTLWSAANIADTITNAGTIQLCGGIYKMQPQESWCAENYGAFQLSNYTWIVRETGGTQTTEFKEGWYWYSTYIDEIELGDVQDQLSDYASQIKSQFAFTTYFGSGAWSTGGLNTFSPAEMYMINVTKPGTLEFTGDFVDYSNTDIELQKNWNWIGYPVNIEVNVNVALANLQPEVYDQIKGKNGFAVYRGEAEGWTPNITLLPGNGYMYYSNSDEAKTFVYNAIEAAEDTLTRATEVKRWNADATQYPSNMTMIAMVSMDGEVVNSNYEVAAFANGELRGSARPIYVEDLDAYVLFLSINGNEVEELTFKYYDVNYGTEYVLNNRINYSNDAIVGSIDEPYMLNLDIMNIDEAATSEISIYPNPTTTNVEINLNATCDTVEVFNALGVKVAEYSNVDSIDALETAGIYVIRITNDGNVQNCRLVVK